MKKLKPTHILDANISIKEKGIIEESKNMCKQFIDIFGSTHNTLVHGFDVVQCFYQLLKVLESAKRLENNNEKVF